MFIKKRSITRNQKNAGGEVISSKTKVLYLYEGQGVTPENEHPETQKIYKKIYEAQTEASIEKGRPVSAYEVMGLYDKFL